MAIDPKRDIQSEFIPFVGNDLTRNKFDLNYTRDQYFQNGVFWPIENSQTGKKTYYFCSRPGLLATGEIISDLNPPLGIKYWEAKEALYGLTTQYLYRGSTNLATVLTSSGTNVGWAETQRSATTQYLCANTGSVLLVIDTSDNVTQLSSIAVATVAVGNPSVVTTSTAHGLTTGVGVVLRGVSGSTPDVNGTRYVVTVTSPTTFTIPVNVTVQGTGGTLGNFPVTTGAIEYMNGYFFVITEDGKIYNCDFNDPLTWDSSKFITAQMYPGEWSALGRQNNFLLAFSDKSTQAFFDNANSAGSPLNNYESGATQIGCSDPLTVSAEGSTIIFAGYTTTGQRTIYSMEGLSPAKDVGTIQIRAWLSQASNIRGYFVRIANRRLYILTEGILSPLGNFFWVYDIEADIWCRWKFAPGIGSAGILGVTYGSTVGNPPSVFLLDTSGNTYVMSDAYTTDNGSNFEVLIQTAPIDFGTQQRKFMRRLEFVADKHSTTSPISISYSDDDAVTFTTARTVDLQSFHTFLLQGGNFRRRVYKFSYTGSLRQRWKGVELYFRVGSE